MLTAESGSDTDRFGYIDMRLYHHPSAQSLARTLAEALTVDLELIERDEPPADLQAPLLWAAADRLELRFPQDRRRSPHAVWVSVDELQRRVRQGGALLRACGVRRGHAPSVLDVMAGTGLDGLVLASRGCAVTLVERQPAVSALQLDLVRRADVDNVTCFLGDGYDVLLGPRRFDVVYLDPMFPPRGKSALPGRRMQMLALLAEQDGRALSEWIEAAVTRAGQRVVLKRRRKDPMVLQPDWQIIGRTVRFDVYRGAPAARHSESRDR